MWWNTQWAFAGVRDPEHKDFGLAKSYDDGRWVFTGDTVEGLGRRQGDPRPADHGDGRGEDASSRSCRRARPAPERKPYLDKSVRERWNDYGIGLLLQGDLRGAEAAFLKVTEMEPGYADGFVNVARVRLQEGAHGRGRELPAQGARDRAQARQDPLLPRLRRSRRRAATTRRSSTRGWRRPSTRATASS